MVSNLSARDREAGLFQTPGTVKPPNLSWGVLVPAVFVGNVALAIFAWFAVGWAIKMM
jgi:hypothetical protein